MLGTVLGTKLGTVLGMFWDTVSETVLGDDCIYKRKGVKGSLNQLTQEVKNMLI